MVRVDLLCRLRNELPMAVTIAALDRPAVQGPEWRFVVLCPRCGELLAT